MSMPTTCPSGPTRWAISRIVSPGPQPASRQRAPGREPDSVEQPAGRGLPHAGLGAQPLVLLGRAPEHVAVVLALGRRGAHRRSSPIVVIVPTMLRGGRARSHRGGLHDLSRAAGAAARIGVGSRVCASVLLDRDAELAALERRLGAIGSGAGTGRDRGGAGRDRQVEPARGAIARSARRARGDRRCARAAARSSRTRPGASPASCSRRCAPAPAGTSWRSARRRSRAARSTRARPSRRSPATPMHAAAHGLVWLACNLAERGPALLSSTTCTGPTRRRCAGWCSSRRRLDELPLGVLCAVRAGEPPGEPELLAELLAAAPEPPVRPRPLGPAAVRGARRRAAARRRRRRSRTPAMP